MNKEHHSLVWHAPEHEHREHSADWYWSVNIITLALAVSFVIAGNILLAIIVILGVGILLVHTRQAPRIVECELSARGVRVNDTLYPWSSLESFWVLEKNTERGGRLLLVSNKKLSPMIVVPLDEHVAPERIREVLAQAITEEPQAEPLPERIMRKLGF